MKHSGIFSKGKKNTQILQWGEIVSFTTTLLIMAYVSNDNPWHQSKKIVYISIGI